MNKMYLKEMVNHIIGKKVILFITLLKYIV
jgi:hypothetical protein